MKKILILLLAGILLTACGESGTAETENEEENEPVFTDEDIALAKEIIEFVHEKETEFVKEANIELDNTINSYEKYQSMSEGFTADKEIREDFQSLSNEMVLDPFLEQYGPNVIEREDREMMFLVNVKAYDTDGERLSLDEFSIAQSYENFDFEEPIIEYHEQYELHELVFPVNKDTTLFVTGQDTNNTVSEEFTFYKSENGELIVGKLSPLKFNVNVSDFEDDPEDVHEDLQGLPSLQ